MPLNPIAHHRGKLADLQIETAVIPGRKTKCILSPIIFRRDQAQITAVQTSEVARQIQTKPMPGNVCGSAAAMKALEDMDLSMPRDGRARVADGQHNFFSISVCLHAD